MIDTHNHTRRSFLKAMTVAAAAGSVYSDLVGNELFNGFKVEQSVSFMKASDFTTWDNGIEPFNFCVIADPHGREDVFKNYEQFGTARDKFSLAIDHIKSLKTEDAPAFILLCGDIHIDAIQDLIDDSGLKFYLIAGNHERGNAKEILRDSYKYFQIDGKESDYYSFIHNNCRFIGMCNGANDHVGHLSSQFIQPFGQSDWLIEQLAKDEKVKIVFAHIPSHPEGKDENMYMSRNDSIFFNKLVEQTSPAIMFFGHQHKATRQLRIGSTIQYIQRSLSWNSGYEPIGYTLVKMDKSGMKFREYTFLADK